MHKIEKNQKQKGFTLVELIVVLVVLAILAAVVVPALLGYIDKAKDKEIEAHARGAYMAAQTIAKDYYSDVGKMPSDITAEVQEMADVPGTVSGLEVDPKTGEITNFKYTENKKEFNLADIK